MHVLIPDLGHEGHLVTMSSSAPPRTMKIEAGKWRPYMSGSTSAALSFEDHFGPVVPEVAPNPASSTTAPSHGQHHTVALRDLVAHMRHCVVTATATPDLAAKIELWESYRTARAEALGILASMTGTSSSPQLRSV